MPGGGKGTLRRRPPADRGRPGRACVNITIRPMPCLEAGRVVRQDEDRTGRAVADDTDAAPDVQRARHAVAAGGHEHEAAARLAAALSIAAWIAALSSATPSPRTAKSGAARVTAAGSSGREVNVEAACARLGASTDAATAKMTAKRMVRQYIRLMRLLLARYVLTALAVATTLDAQTIRTRPDGLLEVDAPAGAVVRYTLDGSDPDRSAGLWLAPVELPAGYTVKARAFAADGSPVGEVVVKESPAPPRRRRPRSCR